jgi:hypothetical protein
MLKQLLFTALLLVLTTSLWAQNGILTGTVKSAKTGQTIIGASIQIEGTSLVGKSDVNGIFKIEEIPTKTYNVICTSIGFESETRFGIIVRSEGNAELNFDLSEKKKKLGKVVIRKNPFKKSEETPLSIQKLSKEEIVSYPGGNNDVAKVVQTLPGVSGSVGGFRNDIIIRGGAPNENVYYLDGIEIPNINHFSTQGSAGGPVGLLNVSFFKGVTLTASAFGAQYDNALSGVLQFDQRNGNARKFQGNFRLSSSEAALTVEGPLLRTKEQKNKEEPAKTTFIASARRSYLQLLFKAIGLPFLPDYYDYQFKVNHKLDNYNDIYVTGVGAIDDFSINELEEYDAEQKSLQERVPVITQYSNTTGVGWRHRLKDNSGFMTTTFSNNLLINNFNQYSDNINQTGLYFKNDARERESRLRYSFRKYLKDWTVEVGALALNANYKNTTEDLVNNRQFISELNFFRYGLFGQASRRLLNDRLGISIGLRADGNTFTNNGNEIYRTLSPRASASYQLTENGKWTATASIGRYFKILPYTVLGFQNNQGDFINKNTDYIQSDHYVAGLEYLVTKKARFSVEGFWKQYDNYPVSVTDQISLANKGGGFEVLGNEPVTSNGKGRAYGLELLFQQKFTGRLYAIAAVTLYKSEFTAANSEVYLPAVWDNGLLVSLVGGYKFGKNKSWEISSRLRYLGETPYAPLDLDATLANYPANIRDYSQLGSVQLNPFSQLDIRLDKKWSFKKWSLDLFLDIQNALATANPAEPAYGLDRDAQGNVITPQQLIEIPQANTGQPLPSLGVVINF